MEWYQKGFGGHLGNAVFWNGPCLIANPQRISAADFELAVFGQTRCGYNARSASFSLLRNAFCGKVEFPL